MNILSDQIAFKLSKCIKNKFNLSWINFAKPQKEEVEQKHIGLEAL